MIMQWVTNDSAGFKTIKGDTSIVDITHPGTLVVRIFCPNPFLTLLVAIHHEGPRNWVGNKPTTL